MAVDFEQGKSYLVSADGDRVTLCGFTAEQTPDLQALYDEAFAAVTSVVGLLLAAGSGERFGGPKALARDDDGTSWLLRSVQALRPCAEIVVVLGAEAERAAALLPMSVARIRADDWAEGMGASLRAGLARARPAPSHDAALVSLVDLPDVDAAVVAPPRRARPPVPTSSRGRRTTACRGTPCSSGRDHWAGVVETADRRPGRARLPRRPRGRAGRVRRPRHRRRRRHPLRLAAQSQRPPTCRVVA